MRHDEFLGLLHYLLAPGQEPTLLWAGRWELAFWSLVLLLAALGMRLRSRWAAHYAARSEDAIRRIAGHRAACVWGTGALVIVLRVLLLPLVPVPVPVVLDEFSYLLGADTFASGRITNPPHPMWVHFETFNVNMRPTYQSMYPPAQALVLALGQKLAGQPWIGVLASVAVMCALFCWMLQAWLPPQWALLGGLWAAARYGIFSYWINSYWGGAVAAIGGALLLGSLARLRRRLSWQQGLVFAAGLAILANSRPFEGFLFALPLILAACWLLVHPQLVHPQLVHPQLAPLRRARLALPCLLLLAVTASGMLYYNWRGTGHALQMPYALNQDTYHVTRPFLFQKPYAIPSYRNPQMRAFYMFHEYPDLLRSRTGWGLELLIEQKAFVYYVFLVWPLLPLFLAGVILAAASAELRIVVIATAGMLAGLCLQIWPAHGHYAAPAASAVLLIQLHALRSLRNARSLPFRLSPVWLSRAIVFAIFLWMLVPTADRLWNPYAFETSGHSDLAGIPREIDRARIEAQLDRTPGQHLVIVHYARRDVPSKEWVYNRADIDHARVVWARDMGPEANEELVRYFATRDASRTPSRAVWYVDHANGLLEPYTYTVPASANYAAVSCHPANGLPPECRILSELGLPQPARP